MKQLFRLFLPFFIVFPAGRLLAQHGDTTQKLYSMTYIVSGNAILLNNDLLTLTGSSSFFRKDLRDKLLLTDEEYGVQYFKGKWRLTQWPLQVYNDGRQQTRSPGNFLNHLDDSNCCRLGHDHIAVRLCVKSMAWTDTLDRSQQLIMVSFVSDVPERVIAILEETDACARRQDYAGALLKFAPVRSILDRSRYDFIDYYADYLAYHEREQQRTALYGERVWKKPPGYDPWKAGTPEYQKKDLSVRTFRNGDPINLAQTHSELQSFSERGMPAMLLEGKTVLYNHYAVTDPRELAAEGWHIPDSAEWTVLRDQLKRKHKGIASFIGSDERDGTFWVSTNDRFLVADVEGNGTGRCIQLRSCCSEANECCDDPGPTTLHDAYRIRCIRFKTVDR